MADYAALIRPPLDDDAINFDPELGRAGVAGEFLAAKTDTTIDALMRHGVDLVLAEHKGKAPKRPGGA